MSARAIISVVDDDEVVRVSVGSLLRSHGYATHLFASAEAFMSSTVTQRCDCLVSDIQMPGMSGLQMYESLLGRGLRLPVIFITASLDGPPRQWASRLGAAGYLVKPFAGQALIDCVEYVLGGRLNNADQ